MAEFHIWLRYISKQHMGAENAFLLRIFDQCAAKTRIFLTRHKVNRVNQMEFMPTPRFPPNGASAFVHFFGGGERLCGKCRWHTSDKKNPVSQMFCESERTVR